jgi:hypothetical protein
MRLRRTPCNSAAASLPWALSWPAPPNVALHSDGNNLRVNLH